MIKVVAPTVALNVIDRAIQVHGGGGVSQDYFLAHAYAFQRALRLADGPDEVHMEAIAKTKIERQAAAARKHKKCCLQQTFALFLARGLNNVRLVFLNEGPASGRFCHAS